MHTAISPAPAVLTCWKDIAQYFGKGVRTVQRWERHFGLPVRRPDGVDHKTAVIAYPHDLDEWLQSRWSRRSVDARRHGSQVAPERGMLSTEISNCLRISRELQRELRDLRKEHRELLDQLSLSLTALNDTCRQSLSHISSSSFHPR